MHHAAVLADAAVGGEEVVDRPGLHLLHHGGGFVRARGLYGFQVVHHRRIGARLAHVGHFLELVVIALRPGAGLVVHVPVERLGQGQAGGGFQADGVDVVDVQEQAGHFLAALGQAEFAGGLDGVDRVAPGVGQAHDLRAAGLGLQ
ncbi:hypothetical protein D9M68_665150 [compost metagenome]